MNNLKNDEYYIGKILTDLHFIVEHMEGVTIRTLGENEVLLDSMSFRLIQIQENAKKLTEAYDEYIDMRTSEKIKLMGGVPHQLSLWDDQIVDDKFAFSILDSIDITSSVKLKDKMEELRKAFQLIRDVQSEILKLFICNIKILILG